MGFINLAEKTVHAKLVYYGIGAGGKTTSLQAVHGIMCPSNEVNLVSIKTEQDATLLFDFLPINLGTVEGYSIIIQGFTVPGQPKYRRMRKYVLQGADAVVLVVDSQRSRLEENIEAFESLQENLRSNGLDPAKIPIIIQYNKRDLDDILSEEEMRPHFLIREGMQAFPSVATDDQGVYETFVHAAGLIVEGKIKQYDLGKGHVDPAGIAKSARSKLWEIFDRWRDQKEGEKAAEDVIEVRLDEDPLAEDPLAEDPLAEDPLAEDPLADDPLAEDSFDVDLDSEEPTEEGLDPEEGDEDLEFGELFTDEDLDLDLAELVDEDAVAQPQPSAEEGDAGLLDMALQSNLQMAEAFGELDHYKAALKRKNDELVKITQNTIHDLNKPLSAIKLMLSSAVKGYFGEVEGRLDSAIQNSMAAVDMMERLMGDLTDSIALDTCFEMKFTEVDLGILITDVLRTLRYSIEDCGIGLRVEPMPVILADEWALTKAFMNLIGNAIQYRAEDRPARVRIFHELDDGFHVVTILDNGIGMPEDEQDKLFLRFQRGSNAAGVSGTGLGLHIVKEAILGHGGTIGLTSKVGEGTTFTIRLPVEPVMVPQSEISQTIEC